MDRQGRPAVLGLEDHGCRPGGCVLNVGMVADEMHEEDARIPVYVYERWLRDLILGIHPIELADEWHCRKLIRTLVSAEREREHA